MMMQYWVFQQNSKVSTFHICLVTIRILCSKLNPYHYATYPLQCYNINDTMPIAVLYMYTSILTGRYHRQCLDRLVHLKIKLWFKPVLFGGGEAKIGKRIKLYVSRL